MNTRVRWHDRCVSATQVVANGPSIFKYRTAVGIIFITSVEHILDIRVTLVSVAPTENKLKITYDGFRGNWWPKIRGLELGLGSRVKELGWEGTGHQENDNIKYGDKLSAMYEQLCSVSN